MKKLYLLLLCLLILPSIGSVTTSGDTETETDVEAAETTETGVETADTTEAELSETSEDCLVLPYISSFDAFKAEPREDGEGHSLYMRFKVDYDYTVEISDLLYVGKNIVRTDKTTVKIRPDERDNHITYTGSNYPDPHDAQLTRYVSFTKSDAYKEARRIYDRLRLNKSQARPREVAPACSPAYIYDADLIVPPNLKSDIESDRTQYEHMKYHKYMTCHKSIQYNGSRHEPLISNHDGYKLIKGKFRHSGTVAAAYSNRVILFANADGAIYANKLDESHLLVSDSSNESPLISLTRTPGQIGAKSRGLDSSVCAKRLYEVNFENAATYHDLDSAKPFRTITAGLEDGTLIVTEANGTNNLHKYYTSNEDEERKHTILPMESLFPEGKFDTDKTAAGFVVSSMAIFQTKKGISRCQAVLRRPSTISHLLYVNSELAPDYSIRDQVIKIDSHQMAEPDDIVYWSSCERIVSFYGFLYTVHHYKANIFEEPSRWHLLNEKLFDYPIEAVHADGDVFYFLTKATTVYKMTVDSATSCSKLRFIHNKTIQQLSQFLGYEPKQFHAEGRYFSAEKGWQPSWNTYKGQHSQQVIDFEPPEVTTKSPPQPSAKEESLIWMYVGLSLLGLLVLVVVVLFIYMLPKRNGHHSRR